MALWLAMTGILLAVLAACGCTAPGRDPAVPDERVSHLHYRGHLALGRGTATTSLALVLGLACAACTSGGSTAATPATTVTPAARPGSAVGLQEAYVSTIHRVLPSVVEIKTASGLGSGVVYDAAGDIVTNAHVVGTAKAFQVFLTGSVTPLPARLAGSYPPDDLAVIKVSRPAHLVPAHFADSSKLQVGDIVLAMGNPLGLASSATDGIISAVGRTVAEPQEGGSPGATLPDAIQTSAAINPGNSGGALVDLSGQVVGIPTLAAADQQLGGAAPGIGFAIPANIVTDIARQIVKTGHVTNSHRAALGVSVQTVAGPDGQPAGVGVAAVQPGSPAAKAGLRAGDVITAVNGTATPDTETLAAVLAGLHPGQQVRVKVTKAAGGTAMFQVTLGQLPGS
jgi:S1-C subfamily serine protease